MFQGKLLDGTIIEDTYPRGNPLTIRLGGGQVIKGLEDGLVGMCIGEIRNLTIPASMAYGSTGIPPLIPPNAILLIKIELVDIEKVTHQSPPDLKIVLEQKDSNPEIKSSDETNQQNQQYEPLIDNTEQNDVPYHWAGRENADVIPGDPYYFPSSVAGVSEDFGKVIPRDPNFFKIKSSEEQENYERYGRSGGWQYANTEESVADDESQNSEDDSENEMQIKTEDDKTFNYGYHNNEL